MTQKVTAIPRADFWRGTRRDPAASHFCRTTFLGFASPAGRRQRLKPTLVCHWVELENGALQCRWESAAAETFHDPAALAAAPR